MNSCTMKEVYAKFGLQPTTQDFIGHAMALYTTDEYINSKGMAKDAVMRIKLYAISMAKYGKSPYIYPLYGLGELPQGFARLSAIYGGTYMLNTKIDEILYDGSKVSGIKATMREPREDGEVMSFETKAKKIIADPSYFPGKVQVVGHLLKAICILTHPVANTDNSDSLQLIIPQSQVGRRNGKQPPHIRYVARQFMTDNTRYIYCGGVVGSQCLSQGILHRHCVDHSRRIQQPPPRTAAGVRQTRRNRGEVHGPADPTVRAT